MSDAQGQQLQEHQQSEERRAPHVKTTAADQQTSQTSPISPQTPTFDPSQYQATLQGTPSSAFARTASAYASAPSVGGLRNPDLLDCILVDHSQVLTLFSHFFQAAEAGAVHIMELITGAIVLELRLHSQGEMQVLLSPLGPKARWRRHCLDPKGSSRACYVGKKLGRGSPLESCR